MLNLLILVVLLCTAYGTPIVGKAEGDALQYRLEETTNPIHYDLTITPYLTESNEYNRPQFTFDATVKIELLVTESKNTLRIHAKNLIIKGQTITKKDSNEIPTISINLTNQTETEILVLTFSENLVANETYVLTFVYSGYMEEDMHGFYRSYYKENGETVWMGSTQMQQTHARRVFPGFDEPLYKATFQLTMIKPKIYTVFSNTVQLGDPSTIDGIETYDQVVFKKTPKMSSYLLAFIVSTFKRRTDSQNRDISFGVIAREAQYNQSAYAYEFGKRSLDILGNYIGYNYFEMLDGDNDKLTKMDMAAIPDFSAGAMENWGLLTYRETNQLYDKDFTTDITKQRIAAVIIHEQAHMWFGDLVTCAWWGDTWLNEGFARFFQYHGTSIAEPLWELDVQFVVEQVQTALLYDSSTSTHPMSHIVNSPGEASSMFDNISYNKGATVLRMIQHLIGNQKFVEAIRAYIKKNEYTATEPQQLFDEFLAVAGEEYPNIIEIIKPWTTQANYPVITVSYDATAKEASVTQKVFLLAADATNTKTWYVPLTYTTPGKGFVTTKPSTILPSTTATTKIKIDTNGWVIFNVQQTGYYRVNYDENNWKLIKAALLSENHDGIHEVNRAQIIDDLFNFARSGERTFEFAFEMFEYLKTEEHYIPWLSAFTTFNFIISKMDTEQLAQFKQYVILLLSKSYESVGWEETDDDAQLTIYHRSNVINWLCKSGYDDCKDKAKNVFDAYKANTTNLVPINIRAAVYCSAMRNGSIEDLDFLWGKYETQEIATEQLTILTAIGCANDKEVLIKAIGNILSSSVRDQDRRSALTNTYTQTEENVQIVLDYVVKNPNIIKNGFGGSLGAVVTTLTSLAGRFTINAQVEQLETFWNDNSGEYAAYKTTFENAIRSAKTQIDWNSENIVKVISQINGNTGTPDTGITHSASLLVVMILSFAVYLLN